jgi:hypothetical protein
MNPLRATPSARDATETRILVYEDEHQWNSRLRLGMELTEHRRCACYIF